MGIREGVKVGLGGGRQVANTCQSQHPGPEGDFIQLATPPPPSSHLGHTSCSPWGKVHTCTFRRVWFLRGQMGHPQPGPLHLANIPIFQKRTLRPREGQ